MKCYKIHIISNLSLWQQKIFTYNYLEKKVLKNRKKAQKNLVEKKEYLLLQPLSGGYQSGQMGQTVNLLA